MISLLYPQSVLEPRMPDEMFREETEAMAAAGQNAHLIDTEALDSGPSRIRPPFESGAHMVYRGWMLTHGEYVNLAASVERAGGSCSTSPEEYVSTHYLPNWYAVAKDYTPETIFLDADADLVSELRRLGWERFFIKGHSLVAFNRRMRSIVVALQFPILFQLSRRPGFGRHLAAR
jgi:hypothetical protein